MKLYVELDAATSTKILSVSTYETDRCFNEVEADGTVDLSKLGAYRLEGQNGVNHLIYDEENYVNYLKEQAEYRAAANANELLVALMRADFMEKADDETAFDLKPLYPTFSVGELQTKGMKRKYNGKLYKVIAEEPFISTAEWTPDVSPSLYVEISGEEYPEYKQPFAGNLYMNGDKASENGKKYICNADNVVYAPSITPEYWTEVE